MSLLSRLFSKKSELPKPQTSSASSPPPCSLQALAQLELWYSKRQFIGVKIPGIETSYQSMVLAVDKARGLIWLDELNPNNLSANVAEKLIIEQRHGDEIISMTLERLDTAAPRREIACLLPHEIHYRPRRSWERFTLPGEPLKAKVRSVGSEPQTVNIINLSGGGMRLALPGNHLGSLHREAFLPLCEFQLGKLHISTQAHVKSARVVTTPYRHTQVSVAFADIPLSTQRALASQLQRLSDLYRSSERSAA
ncbi:flagellar brake protein [Gilvimarinus sp. DA14]|uniref:flagellar brake protein n=1 Tax=Gilvimarinus sp. DA14 TaxID=2956798 RepID=UPI0020B6F8AD|nr:PilZ domain-containing protein [Gilvimarinus sp. DA14]UTF60828.1 PilZ domain-containing protein [Gilvimarinus sp. DA14]